MDFFDRFIELTKSGPSRNDSSADVMLQLTVADDGRVMLNSVNSRGRTVKVDYRSFSGAMMLTLRTLEMIKDQLRRTISWRSASTGNDGVCLQEFPQLMHTLTGCDCIVNDKLDPITVSGQTVTVKLRINTIGTDGKNLNSSLMLDGTDGEPVNKFVMLDECHALAGNRIYVTQPLGPNFTTLDRFVTTLPARWLDSMLSILYSYIDNIDIIYRGHTTRWSKKNIDTVPTLLIEKIDPDRSLYMRVSSSLPERSPENTDNFKLTVVAQSQDDGTILLSKVTYVTNTDNVAAVNDIVARSIKTPTERRKVYNDGNGFYILPEEVAGRFLLDGLPALAEHFRILGVDKLTGYKIKHSKPRLRLSLGSGIDFLDGKATIDVDGEQFTIKDFLAQYAGNHYITLADKTRAVIDEQFVKRLQRIFRHSQGHGDNVKVSFFDLPEIEALIGEKLDGAQFKAHRDFYAGLNALSGKRIKVTGVNATLRDYQRQGLQWINYLYENNLGGCLADDMGLGKTLQTIAMLARIYPDDSLEPSLIVMPRSLLFNWQHEFAKFAPQLDVTVFYGPGRDLDEVLGHSIILTTYAIVRNDIERLANHEFHYVILDESQNIKNVATGVSKAAMLLNCKKRLALSGTPIENNLTELYALFRFLNPGMFGSLEDFNRDYTYPIQRDDDNDAVAALRRRIYPFVLRRLKRDVLDELPERTDQKLFVDMSEAQQDFYNSRRLYYLEKISSQIEQQGINNSQMLMLQAMSELRRIASVPESMTDGAVTSPKLDSIAETVLEAIAGGHKVVIFFNFIAGIELLGERLTAEGIDYTTMTGSTRDRQTVVERFQNDPQCKAMIMTLKTGGVGLNLTAADIVIIAEPWWNKAAEEQAINRLHRIGQHSNVLAYSIITAGTIEEKILQLQEKKAALFDNVIGADAASIKFLSEDDIKFILG